MNLRGRHSRKSAISANDPARKNELGLQFIKNLVHDQRAIWSSPAHVRLGEADWLIPFGGITAGFLMTDRDATSHLSYSPTTLKHYKDLSNYGLAGIVGGAGGFYLLGQASGNAHEKEVGILSGEAALNGLFVTTLIKHATGRERPNVDSFRGRFWQGGDSFPSGHATISWAIASVLSHEYPGPLTKLFAYGAASAITFARVRAEKHFPSDALVGSGIGWLAGVSRAPQSGSCGWHGRDSVRCSLGRDGSHAQSDGFFLRSP
jgi:PAP2 superfamily